MLCGVQFYNFPMILQFWVIFLVKKYFLLYKQTIVLIEYIKANLESCGSG